MNRREILFRGKRMDNGEWVYGSLLNNRTAMEGSAYIIPFFVDSSNFDYIEVYPHTIGQFTGLTDKNGVKIFEGDIVKGGVYTAYEIKWDSYRAEFNTGAAGLSVSEVIGNIHDTHLTKQS